MRETMEPKKSLAMIWGLNDVESMSSNHRLIELGRAVIAGALVVERAI